MVSLYKHMHNAHIQYRDINSVVVDGWSRSPVFENAIGTVGHYITETRWGQQIHILFYSKSILGNLNVARIIGKMMRIAVNWNPTEQWNWLRL